MIRSKPLKRLLLCLMALAMILAYFPAFAWNTYADDELPAPVVIETPGNLMEFASAVNGGQTDLNAVLANDIDFSKLEFAWGGIGTEANPFTGVFNGAGYSIIGLNGTQGLFGHVKDAVINGVNVYGTVTASGTTDIGGIVGCVEASSEGADPVSIAQVGNYVNVTSTHTSDEALSGTRVGGIVGHVAEDAKVEVSASFNKGTVTGYEYVGGIAGRNEGTLTVESCYNAGAVTATHNNLSRGTDAFAGGICATACIVKDSYNTGQVTGYHRGQSQTQRRGYAYTSGTPTLDTCYWLQGSADRAIESNNGPRATGEARFTDGTVLAGLNAYDEEQNPWIEGAKVRVAEEAEPQRYPGLFWEIIDVDGLKALAKSKLATYVNKENYGEEQQELLGTVIGFGEIAIDEATDDLSIDEALADAEGAIDTIPNLDDIEDAKSEIRRYIRGNEYDESQQEEVDEILEGADALLDVELGKDGLLNIVQDTKDALDEIPVSEEVAKADAAKLELRETMVYAASLIESGEYTKAGNIAVNEAIAAADIVFEDPDAFEEEVIAANDAIWEALLSLEASNNEAKSELLSTLISAKRIDGEKFTDASIEKLEMAIAKAEEALADPDAPSGKLRQLRAEVLSAINGLVIDENAAAAAEAAAEAATLAEAKSYLLENMANANYILTSGEYTKETALSLKGAIDAAALVYVNVEASLADVIEADEAILNAVRGLKASNETAKAELLDVLLRARKIDKTLYTAESYAILAAAIQAADEALADPEAPAGKLRHVKTELMSAVNSLVEDKTAAAAAEAAAKAEALAAAKNLLRERMVSAKVLLMAGGCTKDSIAKLQAAMANADTVYKNLGTTEAQVIEADEALRNAMLELEVSTDGAKGELLNVLIRVQSVDKNVYTTSSYAALQNAINAANKLAKDPKATVGDLNDATIEVLNARNSLVKKAANPMKVKKQNKTVNLKKVLKKDVVVKAITVSKAVGKVSYKKTSGSGKFKVNSSNGKITVKKGTKKGKYTIKISVKAAGNGNYLATEKVVSVKIVVK